MSPVWYQPSASRAAARRLGVAPVAREDVRAADEDLARRRIEPHLDVFDRPADDAQRVIVDPVGDREAALGGAEALDDDDADVLPGLLQGGRQEGGGTDEQLEVATEALVDGAEERTPERVGQTSGDRAQTDELRGPALLLDLPLDRRPEEVEDLGHDDHGRHLMGADGLEDDPRVARSDVQDGRPGQERVGQLELAEEVRERQQRDDAVLLLGHDMVRRLERGQDVAVAEHGALRRAGRARGEDDLEERGARRAAAARRAEPPSRTGRRPRRPYPARPRTRAPDGRRRPGSGPRADPARRDRCRWP